MDTLEAESKLSWISIPISFKNSQSGQCSSPQNLDSSFRFPMQSLPPCGIMQVLLLLCWPFPQSPWQRDQGLHDDQKPFLYLVTIRNVVNIQDFQISNYTFYSLSGQSKSEHDAISSNGPMHLAPVKSGPLQVLVLFISPPPQVTEQKSQSLH